jgi:hypothetical protein
MMLAMRSRLALILCLTLLSLCVVAWGWSYAFEGGVRHGGSTTDRMLSLGEGQVHYATMQHRYLWPGWLFHWERNYKPNWTWDTGVLGFEVVQGPTEVQQTGYLCVTVPLWFPTLLLAGVSLLIWRKRRAQRPLTDGRGFALEPPAAGSERPMIKTQ